MDQGIVNKDMIKKFIAFGNCLAMVVSYANWYSIGWAIIHGLLGWVYVIYFFLIHG